MTKLLESLHQCKEVTEDGNTTCITFEGTADIKGFTKAEDAHRKAVVYRNNLIGDAIRVTNTTAESVFAREVTKKAPQQDMVMTTLPFADSELVVTAHRSFMPAHAVTDADAIKNYVSVSIEDDLTETINAACEGFFDEVVVEE